MSAPLEISASSYYIKRRKELILTSPKPYKFNPEQDKFIAQNDFLDKEILGRLCLALQYGDTSLIRKIYDLCLKKQKKINSNLPLIQQDSEKYYIEILFAYHFHQAKILVPNRRVFFSLSKILNTIAKPIQYFIDLGSSEDCYKYLIGVKENRLFFQKKGGDFNVTAADSSYYTSFLKDESKKIMGLLEGNKALISSLFEEKNYRNITSKQLSLRSGESQEEKIDDEIQVKLTLLFSILKERYVFLFDRYRGKVSAQNLHFFLSNVYSEAICMYCKNAFTMEYENSASNLNAFFTREINEHFSDNEIYHEDYFNLMEDLIKNLDNFDSLFEKLKNLSVNAGRKQYITFEEFEELFKKFVILYPKKSVQIVEYLKTTRPDLILNFMKALHNSRNKRATGEINTEIEDLVKSISDLVIPEKISLPKTSTVPLFRAISQHNMGEKNSRIESGLAALIRTEPQETKSLKTIEEKTEMSDEEILKKMEEMNLQNLKTKPENGRKGLFVNGERLCQLQIENEIQAKIDQAKRDLSRGFFSFFKSFSREVEFLNKLSLGLKDHPLPKINGFEQYQELYDGVKAFQDKKEKQFREFIGSNSTPS